MPTFDPQTGRTIYQSRETEAAFQRDVIKAAKLLGWLAYHTTYSRFSARGFPDLVMIRGDRMIMAELKTQVGLVTSEQAKWIAAAQKVPGVIAAVWRPSDWKAITAALACAGMSSLPVGPSIDTTQRR